MTISFSGLASGLDTSSWIKALTTLRQAKVNTLTAQKEKVTVSQSALASLKNYFSTFRSSLEKLTDAKFGISTMDLFTQNIAQTSDASVFTATASTEAKEESYNVQVKKLATNTKANSTHFTQITNTTTAVKESTLGDIGMTSGKVMIKVGGITKGLIVDSSDTISTFVDKLNDIGVAASYNETTGALSMNLSVSDINDKDNTGFVEKLHLEGVNEGYQSTNKLQVVETRENVVRAKIDTKISDLDTGITINDGDYVQVKNSSGEIYNIVINENTTIGDFVGSLKDAGLYANFNETDAVLEMSGGSIIGGTFNAVDIFGLSEQAKSAMATGNNLTETIIISEAVSLQTKLVDDIGVEKGYMEVTKPDGTKYYEKIYSGQTIGDLMADFGNLGIKTSLDPEKGILTVTGGEFRTLSETEVNELINNGTIAETDELLKHGTNLLSILGFSDSTTTIKYASTQSQALTYRKTDVAYKDEKLSDYIEIPDDTEIVIHEKTGEEIGTVTVNANATFDNLFGLLADYGIDGQIHNGQIMIDSSRELYITGDIVDALGFETEYTTTVVTTTIGRLQTIEERTYKTTNSAIPTDVINDFIKINSSGSNKNDEVVIKDKDGNISATVSVTSSSTFADLFNVLAENGVTGQINEGYISMVHNEGGYVDGSFISAIGMKVTYNTVVTTTTVGGTQTTAAKTFSVDEVADYDSVINNFLSINSGNNNLVVKDVDGHVKGSVTVTNTMTFRDLFAELTSLGVDGDIESGQISFFENNGGYVDGSFATALGIITEYTTVTTTTTVGGTQTTAEKTFAYKDIADADSVINDFNLINNTSNQIIIKDAEGNPTRTVTVTNTMTFSDLFSELSQYGVYGGIQDGVMTLVDNNGGYVDGSFCRSMGMATDYTTIYTTTTTGQTSTGVEFNHTITLAATGTTTFNQIGATGDRTWTIMNGQTGTVVASGSFGDSTTIGQFADILGQYGFTAGVEGGYFTASSPQGFYVTGTAADAMGLATYTYTMSAHGTYTSTIAATDTQVINQTRTLDVASTGLVTINAQQTIVVNQTRTLDVASSGYITVTAKQTITMNVSQTLAVTTTQTRTITTTIVNTMTVSQNVTTTTDVVVPQGSSALGTAKKSDSLQAIGLLGNGQSLTFTVNNYTHSGYQGNSFQSYYAYGTYTWDEYSDYHAAYVDYHPAYQDAGYTKYNPAYVSYYAVYHAGYSIYHAGVGYGYTSYVSGYTEVVKTGYSWSKVYLSGNRTSHWTPFYGYQYNVDWRPNCDATYGYRYNAAYTSYVPGSYTPAYTDYTAGYTSYYAVYHAGYADYIPGPYHSAYADYHAGYTTYYYSSRYNYGGSGSSYSYNWTLTTSYTTGNAGSCVLTASDTVQSALDKINRLGLGTASFNENTGQFSLSLNSGYFISDDLASKFGFNTRNTVVYQQVQQHTGYQYYYYSYYAYYRCDVNNTGFHPTFAGVRNGNAIAYLVSGGTSKQFQAMRSSMSNVSTPVTNNTTVNRTMTTTATSVQTVTIVTTGTTTVNVSRTMTVDVSRTVAVNTTGKTTVNIAQTLTINATQTTNVDLTGKTTVNIAQTLTVTAHQTVTVDITSTRTVTANKSTGLYNKYKEIESMTADSQLYNFGLSSGTFSVVHKGTVATVSFAGHDTVDSLISRLAVYGIDASINERGAMTFSGTNDGFIIGATGSAIELGAIGTFSTSTTSIVRGITTSADTKSRLITKTMNGDTTLGQLGLEGGSATVFYKGREYTVNMERDNRLYDFMIALGGYGIAASIKDGKLTVAGTSEGYIVDTAGGIKELGITTSTVKSSTTVVNGTNTATTQKHRTITQTMTSDTTLRQLGYDEGTLSGVYNGTDFGIELKTDSTVGELLSALSANGIAGTISNDGKLTLTGSASGYITGATGGLSSTGLGIMQSIVKTTSTSTQAKTSASNPTREITHTMTANNTFAELGLDAGTAKVNYLGTEYNIAMSAANTVSDLLTALGGFGISATLKDGMLSIQGTNDGYILSTTGGIRDLGIRTSTQKVTTTTVTGDNGLSTTLSRTTNPTLDRSTKIVDLYDKDGNNLGITEGAYYIYENGIKYTQTITADTTINDLLSNLAEHNFIADIDENGTIVISGDGESYLATSAIGEQDNTNMIEKLFSNWDFTKIYNSEDLSIPTPVVNAITRNTRLKDISSDQKMQEGLITVLKNGVQVNLFVNEDDTVGTFIDELAMHGFDAVVNDRGQLIVKSDGNSRLQNYTSDMQASNILDILGINSDKWIQTNKYQSKNENVITYNDEYVNANEDTVLAAIDKGSLDNSLESINGTIELMVDGVKNTITVDENESVGALLNKFRALGLEATIANGQILIQSGYKDIHINESNSTSAVGRSNTALGLSFNDDFGGYSSSSQEIISTTYENKDISVSNWADMDTSLESLNITSGTLSVFRDGQKATVQVSSDDTFATLQSKIQNKLNDVELSFENGYLIFKSNAGFEVATGSSTDTSNFASVTGVTSNGNKVKSAKELYKVNGSVGITDSNLFRDGNITEGTFGIGDATFTIDSSTTLNDIVSMINNSDESGAYAYWDSVDGKLYIESKLSGSMYVNIEKGTSNFTDIMGLTVTDRNNNTTMNIDSQVIGENAEFTINGTTYTSNSNTINSDISRIEGVTLYLKSVSPQIDEELDIEANQTLTIKKDRETLSNAIEEVVDTYNDLMENVDQAISAEGDLSDQTSLKMIRNQLRALMTSSLQGLTSSYRNLDAIGISVNQATGSNISTNNLTHLNFNKDKFSNAFEANPFAVKSLLIGTDTNKGVLARMEDLIESTLAGVSGYFDTQNASYMKQIQQFNDRIAKENRAATRYQEMLENKFSSLDLLVSQMQHQYSSFLTNY